MFSSLSIKDFFPSYWENLCLERLTGRQLDGLSRGLPVFMGLLTNMSR